MRGYAGIQDTFGVLTENTLEPTAQTGIKALNISVLIQI